MDEQFEKEKKETFEIIRKILRKGTKNNPNVTIRRAVNDDEYDFLEDIKDSEGRKTPLFLVKNKIKFAIDMTQKYLGIEPTVDEIMYMTGVERRRVEEYITYRQTEEAEGYEEGIKDEEIIDELEDGDEATINGGGYVVSDGIYVEDEKERKTEVSLVAGSKTNDQNDIYYKELKRMLNKILSTLMPREKQVIVLRFGLNGEKIRTLEEVAARLNISKGRVKDIETRALKKLAEPKTRKYVESFLENPDEDGR